MTLAAPIAYKDQILTVTDSLAETLEELGVDNDDLKIADYLQISVNAGNNGIHFFMGGGTPTAAEGHLILLGADRLISGRVNIRNLKVISRTGSATISITLSRI